MPQLTDLLKRSKRNDVASDTGLSSERLEALAQGADPNMSELRKLAQHFRLDIRELLPPGAKEKTADLLFRQTGFATDENTVSTLSRRIGYSMELVAGGRGFGPRAAGPVGSGGKGYGVGEAYGLIFRGLFFGGK